MNGKEIKAEIWAAFNYDAYNLKGEDILANLRLSKSFAKGLELFLELKDIVDKEVYEETWNEDMNYLNYKF